MPDLIVSSEVVDLSFNKLSGTIPSEAIENLTNLCEFVGHCFPSSFSSRGALMNMHSHGLSVLSQGFS